MLSSSSRINWNRVQGEKILATTYEIQGSCQDWRIRNCPWFTAVQQELKALHALSDCSKIHHVFAFSAILVGRQMVIETVATCGCFPMLEERRRESVMVLSLKRALKFQQYIFCSVGLRTFSWPTPPSSLSNAWFGHALTFKNLVTHCICKYAVLHNYLNTGSNP